ncbi:MAG TPA: hypothetical protein VGL94_10010 [Ktedonobacteraceae bacterium]
MYDIVPEVVSIADACLGSLQGRSALLIGPEERRYPYLQVLRRSRMKNIFQEDTPARLPLLLPHVELVISMPALLSSDTQQVMPLLTAASIAQGCIGRRSPLLIFDLAPFPSVEEMAGLLPAVCLYTPEDLRRLLSKFEMQAS